VKILILHPGALGDIILSLPAIEAVRRQYPGAVITFAANLDFLTATAGGYADRLLSFSTVPLHTLFGPSPDLQFWKAYDRILSWTGAGNAEFETALRSVHPHTLVGRWKPAQGDLSHVSSLFLQSIRPWVNEARVRPPAIDALPEDATEARTSLSAWGWKGTPLVALHPGAGSHAKRWPASKLRKLGLRILENGAALMVIEGPAETGMAEELGLQGPQVFPCIQFGLALQKGYLAHCHAFVGNDSGIAHLAAAMGIPSVVLFGPTLPQNWAPLGRLVVTIRNDSGRLDDIPPDEVHSALSSISKLFGK
jgi:heptosyltransferase III